jgi:hypothetical protein
MKNSPRTGFSRSISILGIALLASLVLAGCAARPYRFGVAYPAQSPDKCVPEAIQVVEGKPSKIVNGVGWVFGIPERVVLWNWRASNHHVTPCTEGAVCEYLARNNLADVKVRVNQYDPVGEFCRLKENKRMSPVVRYTCGTLSVVSYAVVPGRVFGGDFYNPYTNTVNVFSDVPAIAVREAAYAKDIHNRPYPGAYAALNEIPVIALWHETINTRDALGYFGVEGNCAQQREAYHVLVPRYGAQAGGALRTFVRPAEGAFLLSGGPLPVAGALVGHAVGRVEARKAEKASVASSTPVASQPTNLPEPLSPASTAQQVNFESAAPAE